MHEYADSEPLRRPVLDAKTEVPATPRLVTRQRLVRRLHPDPDGQAHVTLVCAPVGAGKTTLLCDWARHRPRGTAVAWLSLGPEDDDVGSLWSSVLLALERSGAWAAPGGVRGLDVPRRRVDGQYLARFTEAFGRGLVRPVVLVLDDLQELGDPEVLAGLDLLLRYPPPRLDLVLSSRFPPPLSLPRLRVEGRVRDVEPAALAFTQDEADALLRTHGVVLPVAQLRRLLVRTEGWAAGLRLAALSMAAAASGGPRELISGESRAVADYLVGEVLAGLDEPLLGFLHRTAVCARFTADLAGRLSGRDDAALVLADLERTNFPLTRLGRDWYRYHPLVRQYLQADLRRRRPGEVAWLHAAAARWFEGHGERLAALEHAAESAAQSGDVEVLAELFGESGLRLVASGESAEVLRVLDRVPGALSHPVLAAVAAAAALDRHDPSTAARALPVLSCVDAGAGAAVREAVRLSQGRANGDAAGLARALTQPLLRPGAPVGNVDADLVLRLERGWSWHGVGRAGAAERELTGTLQLARQEGREWMVLQCLALLSGVAAAQGRYDLAGQRAVGALALAAERGWSEVGAAGAARTTLGWIAHLRAEEDRAGALAAGALVATEPGVQLAARLLATLTRFGSAEHPYAVVEEVHRLWRGRPAAPDRHVAALAALEEQRTALAVGATSWAVEATERTAAALGEGAEVSVMGAVNQVHRGRPRAARQLLGRVLSGSVPSVTPATGVTAWVWEARLAARAQDRQRGEAALAQAVALAAPQHLVRPFVHGGREVTELLSRRAGTFGHAEPLAQAARTVLGGQGRPAGGDPLLTTRETEMLNQLPSMLTAEEIADSLFLSVNTVKTHLRGIYRKLGVNNRRDAVQSARGRGLL